MRINMAKKNSPQTRRRRRSESSRGEAHAARQEDDGQHRRPGRRRGRLRPRSASDPHVDIPSRTLSNVRYSPRKRILEMGNATNRRQLFDLSQAKAYMRTMLVASGCKKLLDQGKTTSLRGMFYMLKHTIEGTKENTFDDQSECDTIIEDIEVLLDSLREELHLYADEARRRWSATSRSSTTATRSTARGWAPAATAFRRSSSPR